MPIRSSPFYVHHDNEPFHNKVRLAAKIRDPSLELAASKAARAVMELLSTDGF